MSPKFDPEPKDSIHLFGQKYTVQPLPSAPWAPYASIAGRAVVYQLRDERGGYFALKVFKKRYRSPELVDSVQKLGRVENFEGLRAAKHWVVRASDPASQKYRDLEYAMLMPWIFGKT